MPGWPLWDGFARGERGRAHTSILDVAERALRRSVWSGKSFRRSTPEEQSRLVFTVAEIVAQLLADDYRRARELGLDLAELATNKQRRTRRGRQLERASVLTAVGELTDEETALTWYRDASEKFESTGDEESELEHRWYRQARDRVRSLSERLRVDR